MRTHVVLLRGINVGGHHKLAMADLRRLISDLGCRDVATYVQSGNAVFDGTSLEMERLAVAIEQELEHRHAIRSTAIVLDAQALLSVVAANPYPHEDNPRHLHAVFHRSALDEELREAVVIAAERARNKGSRDEATVVGSTIYLRTPQGMGQSVFAAELARSMKGALGTARNWATVGRLVELLDLDASA